MNNGQQPLSNQDDDVHVVVDGELYDFKRMRSELQAKGHRFRTESDSEIALCLYQEYGLSFLDHLRGEFAVCIWDVKKSRFILARDRFGAKPLYYTIVKGALLVASEIKAFLALGWEPAWDVDSLMNNGVMFDCRTAFKGVNKLPPAHYMAASSAGSIQIRPYWCQKYANKLVKETRTVESMIQGVQDRLVDAVRQRLEADVAVGIYLDGSVSTSCVAGIANQIRKESSSKENIKAFSLGIVGASGLNESAALKRTAEFCGAELETVQVSEKDLLDVFEESVWHTEQPHLDLRAVGRFILSKAVNDRGYKVVLTGEGAEEHFAGHPHFLKDYLREADDTLPDGCGTLSNKERIEIQQKMDTGKNSIGSKNVVGNMLNDSASPAFLETSFTLARSFYSEAAIEKYRHRDPALTVAEALNGISRNNASSKWHPLHTAMSIQCTTLLPNHALSSFSDRPAMAHSVEARLPFLDHQLCDYVNSLPPSVKIKAGKEGKLIDTWMLRQAAKPFVTTEVYEGSNRPSYSPLLPSDAVFVKLLEKHLTEEKIARLGWINYHVVKAAKEDYYMTKSHKTYQDLVVIMSYVVLSEKFNVATARFEVVTFSPISVEKQSTEGQHQSAFLPAFLKKIAMTAVVVAPIVYTYYF